eukprot:scaffold11524_cov91-Cylindrotheca_fusiformis.AAC.1
MKNLRPYDISGHSSIQLAMSKALFEETNRRYLLANAWTNAMEPKELREPKGNGSIALLVADGEI